MQDLELMVTLCPTFSHYKRFARDRRLAAVRLNSAMVFGGEVDKEIAAATAVPDAAPLYFDIKGRQLRIREVVIDPDHLEITLNHPIRVATPTVVLFKAGSDHAVLKKVVDGKHLIFEGGPHFLVKEGESICIRHPSLRVLGPVFCDYEIEKITKVVKAGFTRFFLSYVEGEEDLSEFRNLIGDFDEIILKIESKAGLGYVANHFLKRSNISLCAARGDMYVEIEKPHEILNACKLIAEKDPEALVGSRLLLSLVANPVPECHDFSDMAWLYDIGYRRMMLCDELCLKEPLLSRAVNVFDCFREEYAAAAEKTDVGKEEETPLYKRWFPSIFST